MVHCVNICAVNTRELGHSHNTLHSTHVLVTHTLFHTSLLTLYYRTYIHTTYVAGVFEANGTRNNKDF